MEKELEFYKYECQKLGHALFCAYIARDNAQQENDRLKKRLEQLESNDNG